MQTSPANTCPWQIVKTPRALLEQQMLYIQLQVVALQNKQCQFNDPQPDCWMLEDGSAFYTRSDRGTLPLPKTYAAVHALIPGKTIVRVRIWQTALTSVWHEQAYIGRGYCASFASDDQLVLARLTRTARTPAKFILQYDKHAIPVHVLTRAAAALGAMQWDPYRINCQSVTTWIMTGRLPATTAVAVAANEAMFFGAALCSLICIIWAILANKRK